MLAGPSLLLLLLAGHALADFPLQGRFLAEGKDRHTAIGRIWWPHALAAHSLIHGGFVTILTGSAALGFAEAAAHWLTDWLKCEGKIGVHVDQTIHLACKVLWFLLASPTIP
jgi:hypothetical protein